MYDQSTSFTPFCLARKLQDPKSRAACRLTAPGQWILDEERVAQRGQSDAYKTNDDLGSCIANSR